MTWFKRKISPADKNSDHVDLVTCIATKEMKLRSWQEKTQYIIVIGVCTSMVFFITLGPKHSLYNHFLSLNHLYTLSFSPLPHDKPRSNLRSDLQNVEKFLFFIEITHYQELEQ